MRFQELVTPPEGKRVTEKAFVKVLVSSVCGMLLCMACLAGTTWALFSVSVENTENVIRTADTPKYNLLVNGQTFLSGDPLLSGEHTVTVTHDSNADDLQRKCRLYVTLILDDAPCGYLVLGGEHSDSAELTLDTKKDMKLSWAVSWFEPGNPEVLPLTDPTIQITEEESDPVEASTETSVLVNTQEETTAEPEAGGTDTGLEE